jgi:ABC-type transport system involved in multi-copper enzyme maturation permease subunit
MNPATVAPRIPPPVPQIDFPTWLPAMFVKELRQGLRTRGFVVAFVAFQILMALLMMGAVVGNDAMTPGARAGTAAAVNGFFWTLLTVQLLFVTPARALGSLQTEIEVRSLDLLLLTRLSAWRIVFGKWASLVAQSVLLLVAMLPYGIVRYFAGSADLVSDAGMCGGLLGVCAVLTAAGLWSSGMSKLVRVVAVIAIVAGTNIWRAVSTGSAGSLVMPFAGTSTTMLVFDGALALVFFLVAAVRRIAPPSENHAFLARVLPLIALLPVPAWALAGASAVAEGQFLFAACFTLLACTAELATVQAPMAVHLRPWLARGPLGRFVGRFALPGWPSAMIYTIVAVAGPTVVVLAVPGVVPAREVMRAAWFGLLALGALTFPVVALTVFKRTAARSAGSLYGLVLGAMSTLAATAAALAAAFPARYGWLQEFARLLPVSGFWLSLGESDLTDGTMMIQGILIFAALGFVGWMSRGYWRHVAFTAARERAAGP